MLARPTLSLLSTTTRSRFILTTPPKATLFSLWVRSSPSSAQPSSSSFVSNKLNPSSSSRSFSTSPSSFKGILPSMNSPEKIVQESLKKDFISVFSKSWCPFCTRAKNLLSDLTLPPGKEIKIFELDQLDNGAEIQDYLATLTGQRSVPNIFIQGQHLGGSDDLVKASDNGKLAKMLEIKAGL